MKITHVTLAKERGGGEHQLIKLVNQIAKKNIKQTLLCRKVNTDFFKQATEEQVTIKGIDNLFTGHFNQDNQSIFHAHCGKSVHWCHLHKKLFPKSKYIVTRRVINPLKQKKTTLKAYQQAEIVVAISQSIAKQIANDTQLSNIKVIYDGINLPQNTVLPKSIKDKEQFVILQVGNISQHKGYETTLQISKLCAEKPFKFIIAGQNNHLALTQAIQSQHNIEYVGYKNNLENDYMNADLFLFPSRLEGLGSSVIEAMSYGLPVVASRCGGIPELIDQNNGHIIDDIKNPHDFLSAIESLLKNHENYYQISKTNIKKAKHFSAEQMAKHYLDIYESV